MCKKHRAIHSALEYKANKFIYLDPRPSLSEKCVINISKNWEKVINC